MIRKIRIIFRTSPKAGLLTSLFVLSLAVLLVVLWREVRKASDIELPIGQQHISSMMAAADGQDQDRREILVLNSYHLGYSWSDNEMRGIVEALLKADPRYQPVIEFLDCKHYPRMEHFDRVRDLLRQKYRDRVFPVVIVADNPALQFALKYRPQLFPKAAIVFCGINGYDAKMVEGHENVTGVAELLDAEKTLSIALKFHPGTRTVVVVHDYTITGLASRRETEKQLKPFAGRINIVYLENMPTRELMEQLQRLTADNLVLALSYSLDREGQIINHETISRILSRSAPVPVYGLHEERLGFGIVGGSLLGGTLQGKRAAELAARVLAGEPASRIPVDLRGPTRMMFDHNQLVRFGVPDSSLPREAIIVNRPVTLASERPVLVAATLGIMVVLVGGIVVLGFNIYQRKIAEDEQRKLQAQLMQAQKMEAVGLLAGGVAHDFNNILTAIIGYANLLRKKVSADEQLSFFAGQILSASNRAAGVTRSLLAFSRKQVIEPKPADLNTIVQGIDKIAKRLIGEDIEFRMVLAERASTVMADSGQMEQVLLNLCTNARDAMPHGGNLTIETGWVKVDEDARRLNFLDRTGWYGVICVSDTGVGMDEGTRKQIFEPFFTTKEAGKGTGLGLSIAYGIIKQHNGTINVYSETGKGTTFKIYLPLIAAAGEAVQPKAEARPAGGNETILLAEDENDVRVLITHVLRDAGYSVIEAATGDDAVKTFAGHADRIALLISDVIMPKMNGKDAYVQIKKTRPDIKVLFMSGYTADIIKSKGILEEGHPFLSKPIIPDQLLRKVREVIDRP
jgi:signal transduction histidine kinase/ActR/RegA family two-component response regulator